MKKEWAFYQWSVSDLEKHFDVKKDEGLSDKRAYFRLEKYGPNSLQGLNEVTAWDILLRQFKNFFIYLLLVATIISYFIEGMTQTLVLVFIVFINIALGFFQEYKAEKSLSELKKNFNANCKVLRDGKIDIIENADLVPGDVVIIEAGDIVPADLRIIESESLRANESALTGESVPANKQEVVLSLNTPLPDRINMLYGSTQIVAGNGRGIVVATGIASEFGRIAGLVKAAENDKETPLEKQVLFLGKMMSGLAVIAGLVIFIIGFFRGYDLLHLLTYIISMIVSVVPESLPTVITLTLAIGVSRMAKKKAIVRKMSAIEALGTVNIIATDKTGTLTNNKLEIEKVLQWDGSNFQEADRKTKKEFYLYSILSSKLNTHDKQFIGDPLDVAIAEKAHDFDPSILVNSRQYERVMEIPFDSEKKYMGALLEHKNDKYLIVKGSAEKIIDFCSLSKPEKRHILTEISSYSQNGYRIIALATKKLEKHNIGSMSGMTFLGLMFFVDEPAEGVSQSIQKLLAAGVRTIILTGDHPETAKFIANKVGLKVNDDEVIAGNELEEMKDKELKTRLEKVKIFARVSPEDKNRIVKILQKNGYSVAVTGDGVNDAPALAEATVGIAMGLRGTDVAKESSSVILSDDSYETVVSAIEYGRTIFDNIKNAVFFLLAGNLTQLLIIAVAFIFDFPLPLTPVQILWVNVVIESFLAVSMSFESPGVHVLKEKPRPLDMSFFKKYLTYSAILAILCFIFGMHIFLDNLAAPEKAQTLLFTYIVFNGIFLSLSIRSKSRIWENPISFLKNHYLLAAIALTAILQFVILFSPSNILMKISPVSIGEVIYLFATAGIVFLLAEVIRALFDRGLSRAQKIEEALSLGSSLNN